MNTIGPQRALPSSVGKISAEVEATKRQLEACKTAAQRLRLYWDVEVTADFGMDDETAPDVSANQYHNDVAAVVDAFYQQWRLTERLNDPPTREMLVRLGAIKAPPVGELVLSCIHWIPGALYPAVYVGMNEVEIDTIGKLRAALLLTNHPTPDEL